MTKTLYPLAFPKGVKYNCELCSKPANLMCEHCHVTYYCATQHQKMDWVGIHEIICSRLKFLETPVEFLPTADARQKKDAEIMANKLSLIELVRTTTQRQLNEEEYERAIPAALQYLRLSMQMYGIGSPQLIVPYLTLGEASLGMGKASQADGYLQQASWTALKSEGVSRIVKSRLNRNLGMLQSAKGQFQEALAYLAEDVYQATMVHGTEDIHVSGGYYHMATIFFKQGHFEIVDSLYTRVTDMWRKALQKIVASWTQPKAPRRGVGPGVVVEELVREKGLDEAEESEGRQVLQNIYIFRLGQGIRFSRDLAIVAYALAMLSFLRDDLAKAKEYGKLAVMACRDIPDDSLKQEIKDFVKLCRRHN